MPIVEFLVGSVSGALIVSFTKSWIDAIWTSEWYIKRKIANSMIVKHTINLAHEELIDNDILLSEMIWKIQSSQFGIFVLAAPSGSGKSTFVKMTIERMLLLDSPSPIKLYDSGSSLILQENGIHDSLQVPYYESLANFLPNGSILIIDQVDPNCAENLDDRLRAYLVGLAANSVNSKRFKIIICVSNALLAHNIVTANGYEKIQYICSPQSLQWTESQAQQFSSKLLTSFTEQQLEVLFELASKCGYSPGLFMFAAKLSEFNQTELENYARRSMQSWSEFSKYTE